MGRNSTLFYLVSNINENSNYVLSDQIFANEHFNQQVSRVSHVLDHLEYEVRDTVLDKVLDYARSVTH